MSEPKNSAGTGASAAGRPYDPPRIVHEEKIEAVAVACEPASNPGLPVKNFDGEITAFSVCQNGFLNS